MNTLLLQLAGNLAVAGAGAWIGGQIGVKNAMQKLRNEKAFERRLAWYEDTVASMVAARDLFILYAAATRQRDATLLGNLVQQMTSVLQRFGDKASMVGLYAPRRTVKRLNKLVKDLRGLASEFIQTLQRGQLYEEFAARVDVLVASLNELIFDLAQELRGELGIEKIEPSDLK
jgi:hypothetical protein